MKRYEYKNKCSQCSGWEPPDAGGIDQISGFLGKSENLR